MEIPKWFPRALQIAQLADLLALSFSEAEWLVVERETRNNANHWYARFLFSKSQANQMTQRKRLTYSHTAQSGASAPHSKALRA